MALTKEQLELAGRIINNEGQQRIFQQNIAAQRFALLEPMNKAADAMEALASKIGTAEIKSSVASMKYSAKKLDLQFTLQLERAKALFDASAEALWATYPQDVLEAVAQFHSTEGGRVYFEKWPEFADRSQTRAAQWSAEIEEEIVRRIGPAPQGGTPAPKGSN